MPDFSDTERRLIGFIGGRSEISVKMLREFKFK